MFFLDIGAKKLEDSTANKLKTETNLTNGKHQSL